MILCGLPFVGKTTVGKKLAERLDWAFIDTDALIEEATGQSCRTLFKEKGEGYFRFIEKEQIAQLKKQEAIIAIGGGSLIDPSNREKLSSLSSLIYLKASPKILWQRRRKEPLYDEQSYYTLASMRIPLYEKMASVTVDVGAMSETDVVEALWQVIHSA